MKVIRRISIGGWVFLIHFFCVAIVFSLPWLIPQPRESITSGDHWYWDFLQFSERLFFWVTLPVSCFMSHPRDTGLYLFDYPVTAGTVVPFCVILALNSLLIGYTTQLLVRGPRRPRAARSTAVNDEQFRRLLDEHRGDDA
jgi:hypothetical protein